MKRTLLLLLFGLLVSLTHYTAWGQTGYLIMSKNNPSIAAEKIEIDSQRELIPQTFKIEKLSRRDIKKAARTKSWKVLFVNRYETDEAYLKLYQYLLKSIKDTSVSFNDIFNTTFDSTVNNLDVSDCWLVPINKINNKETLWTYNMTCHFPSFRNSEDLKHWYELYIANLNKRVKSKFFKKRFDREEYVYIVLDYYEKLKPH